MTRKEIVIAALRRQGIRAKASGLPSEIWVHCPFCILAGKGPDAEGKLGVNVSNGKGHCFRCGWRSRHALADLKLEQYHAVAEDKKSKVKLTLPPEFELIADIGTNDHWIQRAMRYLLDRGMSIEQIKHHKVMFSLSGRFGGRVLFPIYRDRVLQGFSGRAIVKGIEPRWLHSFRLSDVYPAQLKARPIITIVEGIFDALKVERFVGDLTDVVGLLGTNLTEVKAQRLAKYNDVVVWLDNDVVGHKGAIRIAEQLMYTKNVWVVLGNVVKDPGDMSEKEILATFHSRQPWTPQLGLKIMFDGG